MKKLLFIIFLMVFSFAITANAKKPKVVWPKAVLTLKDGTVLNGYLQNDIHFMKKNIYFSETQNGKDVKYKIVDIKSLEVDNALQDGKKRTFILIDEDPTFQYLATVIYKGKHVTGYMQPFAFESSTHSRSFTKFKDYPAVAEEVEKRGLTAEQIHEDPTILLEILDKSLQ